MAAFLARSGGRGGALPKRPISSRRVRHLIQGRAGEENLVHTATFHRDDILRRNRPAPAAKQADVRRALFSSSCRTLGKKLDVSAVITRKADGADVLLHGGPDDVARRAMVAEINHLEAVADELEVDRVDGAVVPIANRHGGQQAERWRS